MSWMKNLRDHEQDDGWKPAKCKECGRDISVSVEEHPDNYVCMSCELTAMSSGNLANSDRENFKKSIKQRVHLLNILAIIGATCVYYVLFLLVTETSLVLVVAFVLIGLFLGLVFKQTDNYYGRKIDEYDKNNNTYEDF